ncbi:hypothetical protein NDU88_007620 [Pleurodeles waltl]|uniref:Uncharacterized protein n=1 Tax=Pleurodeles waltl TaxID=8319 RepID=A0AAV7U1R5_PLEWA|nr:hypothetical protein NDU88_007620 [Pleurodeles waltl]
MWLKERGAPVSHLHQRPQRREARRPGRALLHVRPRLRILPQASAPSLEFSERSGRRAHHTALTRSTARRRPTSPVRAMSGGGLTERPRRRRPWSVAHRLAEPGT